MTSPPEPVPCPECHHVAGVVIVYGMPPPEVMRLGAEGSIAFGGCVINTEEVMTRRCRDCHAAWRDVADTP